MYRNALPQLKGDIFLTDAGMETDLIFNHGIEIRGFASHTLLPDETGRAAMADYFRSFLSLANDMDAGFIFGTQTWKAHMHWADDLGESEADLKAANFESVAFSRALMQEFAGNAGPIVLEGTVGPIGDAYAPESDVAIQQAEDYHIRQIGWLADAGVDMVTALTFTQSSEATGFVRAAKTVGIPSVVSFTVETDGNLPTGQSLDAAIEAVDEATDAGPAYYMINCAHPDHFCHVLEERDWARRIHGLRCNASRKSHAELDNSETLDPGNPAELGGQYGSIFEAMPWLNVFGGCCGSDLRHVREIARAVCH